MKNVTITRRFDAAFTRMLGSGEVIEVNFQAFVEALHEHDRLPPEWNEHLSTREWQGYWDAHLDNDVVIIYKRVGQEVRLTDIGRHEHIFLNYRRRAAQQGRLPGESKLERDQSTRRARRQKEKGRATFGQWPG